MGNSNAKRNYNYQQYESQYSLSDLIGGSCVATTHANGERRSWSYASHRSWARSTSQESGHGSSKTVWPVPRFQSIFLPEFPVERVSLNAGYSVLDTIAKGAYGKVYKVQRQDTGEVFALKVISKAVIVAENAVRQAKEEVAIQRMVGHHPFIVNSTHRWQGRKTLYILMDYISRGELHSLVDDYGCLPEEVVRIYVAEIALAIDFLHNAGIVHRDLKATNILLDENGHAVIIDFGLAKWLPRNERTSTLCGTPRYMAPEILRRERYGHEVDWWSLGVLTCFLLTNKVIISPLKSSAMEEQEKDEGEKPARKEGSLNSPELLPPATYPSNTSPKVSSDQDASSSMGSTVVLPANVDVSPAARDLVKRLLQPEPRLRLRNLLSLQRIAFYMGHDLQSYMLKKESPFRILESRNPRVGQRQKENGFDYEFRNFDSFPGASNT